MKEMRDAVRKERRTVEDVEPSVHDTLDWMDKNHMADNVELAVKVTELDGIANPTLMKLKRRMTVHGTSLHVKYEGVLLQ